MKYTTFIDGKIMLMFGNFPYPTFDDMEDIEDEIMKIKMLFKNNDTLEMYNKNQEYKLLNMEHSIEKKERILEGYVYFIRDTNGKVKIGKAKNPELRFNRYITENSHEIDLLHTIKYNIIDYGKAEKMRHTHFYNKNYNRERFSLEDDDIKYILSKQDNFIIK